MLRYRLGGRDGSATASSVLAANAWQGVRLTILNQMLWLTSNETTDTRSLPALSDLSTSTLYVGGAQDKIRQRTQFASGFYGCVLSSLWAAGTSIDLSDLSTVTHFSVEACQQSPCARLGHACANGGQCLLRQQQYACSCPLAFAGKDCSQSKWHTQSAEFLSTLHLSKS